MTGTHAFAIVVMVGLFLLGVTPLLIVGIGIVCLLSDRFHFRRTIGHEEAVIVSKRGATRKVVAIDQAKEDAIAALVRDGWKRSAAVSALASTGWAGYPRVEEMVLSAWQSMPSYR